MTTQVLRSGEEFHGCRQTMNCGSHQHVMTCDDYLTLECWNHDLECWSHDLDLDYVNDDLTTCVDSWQTKQQQSTKRTADMITASHRRHSAELWHFKHILGSIRLGFDAMQCVLQGTDENLAAVVSRNLALLYQWDGRHQRLYGYCKITYTQTDKAFPSRLLHIIDDFIITTNTRLIAVASSHQNQPPPLRYTTYELWSLSGG